MKGLLKYASEERVEEEKAKKMKKLIKKQRRRTYLVGAVKKLEKDIDSLYIILI